MSARVIIRCDRCNAKMVTIEPDNDGEPRWVVPWIKLDGGGLVRMSVRTEARVCIPEDVIAEGLERSRLTGKGVTVKAAPWLVTHADHAARCATLLTIEEA